MVEQILLTGSTGCLGSHILEELAKFEKPVKLYLLIRNLKKFDQLKPELDLGSLNYEVVHGDLDDFELVRKIASKVDTIFHVAAVFDFVSKWDRFVKINVEATRVIVEAMKPEANLILTSSDGIYGFPDLERGLREDEPPDPYGYYHESKLLQENLVKEICSQRGINFVVIRPTNIVGPRDYMTARQVIESIQDRSMILVSRGRKFISIVHPKDIARAHILAYEKIVDVNGESFHITSTNVTWKQYIHRFCDELEVKRINRSVPYFLAYFIGFLGDIAPFQSVYSRFNVKFAGTNRILDISKAKNQLGYQPAFTLDDIVKHSVEWYKSISGE